MLHKTLITIGLLLCLTSVIFAQDSSAIQNEAAQSAWREDLHLMYEKMQTTHPNLFWRTPEADFKQMVADLDADIPSLTDEQIKVRLMQIVALVDGHTQIGIFQPALDFHLYGLRLYTFSDGIYVVDAQPLYKEAVGKKLVSISSTDVDSVYQQVSTVAPHDNDTMLKLTSAFYMVVPEVLHAMGIVEDVDQPAFVVEDEKGQSLTINPKPLTLDEYLKWGNNTFITLPPNPDVLYLQHQYDETFWFTYLADSETLYIQYNEVRQTTASGKTMIQFVDELESFIKTNPIEQTILDVRHNPGGDNHFYPPLLRLLQQNETLNRPDKLYVIIGRMTLSAAVNFVTELEQSLHPIFVGEPTGEAPNLYGDTRPITLPNSKIQVDVSSLYWQKSTADDERLAIVPSISTPLSSTDYFNGRDPAIEAIFKDNQG
jgi:hypothetical protein